MKELSYDILFGIAVADAVGAAMKGKSSQDLNEDNYKDYLDQTVDFSALNFTLPTAMALCTTTYITEIIDRKLHLEDLDYLMQELVDIVYNNKYGVASENPTINSCLKTAVDHFIESKDRQPQQNIKNDGNQSIDLDKIYHTDELLALNWDNNIAMGYLLPTLLFSKLQMEIASYSKTFIYQSDEDYYWLEFYELIQKNPIVTDCCKYYLEFAEDLLALKEEKTTYFLFNFELNNTVCSIKNFNSYKLFKGCFHKDFLKNPTPTFNSNGHIFGTLQLAIYCLLTTESYEAAVIKAISFGGDTSTNAAATGGLAGLRYGYEAIPSHWINSLKNSDEIRQVIDQLTTSYFSKEENLSLSERLELSNKKRAREAQLEGAYGEFGWEINNPIPLPSKLNYRYYFRHLITTDGDPIEYKLIGSKKVAHIKHPIDIFEITCKGKIIGHLHLSADYENYPQYNPKGLISKHIPN